MLSVCLKYCHENNTCRQYENLFCTVVVHEKRITFDEASQSDSAIAEEPFRGGGD